eukprot:TRINITY_DN15670_c0_g1_i1.p1 TRINITY_DN15670_c0_g1~~TRINITY_DN15670_c0_g1_i1.p1  ORF type:complete len:355 (+),score=73.96 TRINITY_DN15670_c0_g1_i1:51-1067(+)
MSQDPRFFITGGQGFIGSWIIEKLLNKNKNTKIVVLDLEPNNLLMNQIISPENMEKLERIFGNTADTNFIKEEILKAKPTHIIHLAALQIPTCRLNPILGATVNVVGHLNIFEAAKCLKEQTGIVAKIAYASSAAVAGPESDYTPDVPIKDNAHHVPRTHYGVFKIANEGNSYVYWQDHQIPSVGLRPLTVYGVGREIGLTSAFTKIIKATVLGVPFKVPFAGKTSFNYVEDIAQTFIDCVLSKKEGAYALNCKCEVSNIEDFMKVIKKELPESEKYVQLDPEGQPISIAYDFDFSGLKDYLSPLEIPFTPIVDAVPKIIKHFRLLKEQDRLHDRDLH